MIHIDNTKKLIYKFAPVIAIGIFIGMLSLLALIVAENEKRHFQQLSYSLRSDECSMSEPTCKINVTITNPTNKTIEPQYVDTGGGPGAGVTYNIKIFDTNGDDCYGFFRSGSIFAPDVRPHSSVSGEFRCTSDTDFSAMNRPNRIVIYGREYKL